MFAGDREFGRIRIRILQFAPSLLSLPSLFHISPKSSTMKCAFAILALLSIGSSVLAETPALRGADSAVAQPKVGACPGWGLCTQPPQRIAEPEVPKEAAAADASVAEPKVGACPGWGLCTQPPQRIAEPEAPKEATAAVAEPKAAACPGWGLCTKPPQ
jgi:hypothetical protein